MNIKKLFALLAGVSMVATTVVPSANVFGATYSEELQGAYNWAHENGITTMDTIDRANMYGAITRAEMAKMLANYAKSFTDREANASAACNFTDTASVKGDLATAIVEACQYGIMGQGISAFRPYDTISRAEFGTALSRLLWGTTYEGGTPYYAKHLEALKAAGIMNQIANAESTKEVRGYVMLMLERASDGEAGVDCEDPLVMTACLLDSEDCPAACREADEDPEDIEVKSGDLAVSATASTTKKAIIGGVSDLDTLTFKSSEEVEISRVTLERYGYSKYSDIDEVRLEDEDGNVIAEAKGVTSKDQVTLSLKKDYRTVDGELNATIVVKVTSGAKVGSTLGFKVTSTDSSAENLNIKNYEPNTYEIVDYKGSEISVEARVVDKSYNYVDGNSYEVAKFKVKAGDAPIVVKGFTLTQTGSLDIEDFFGKVTVSVDDEAVKGAKYSISDDELTVSFSDVEIEARSNVTFVVEAELSDLDEFGETIQFEIAESSDFSAVETKTDARVSIKALPTMGLYRVNGGEVKFSNVKVGNVDASQGATDVLVAEGTVTVDEALDKVTIVLEARNLDGNTGAKAIDEMRISINGEEYDGTLSINANGTGTVTFKDVEIEKSGKVKFYVDLKDDEKMLGAKFSFTSLNKNAVSARYAESRENVTTAEIAGSISFDNITVQKAKASFENDLDKTVSFLSNSTTKNTVFEGTLTAKKASITLQDFSVEGVDNYKEADDFLFHLYINDKEIKSVDLNDTASISYEVEADEDVKVKVVAEVDAGEADATRYYSNFQLVLDGEDDNGVAIATLREPLVDMKVVVKAQVEVETADTKATVLKKGKNQEVAAFTLKSENNEEGLMLEDFTIVVVAPTDKILSGDDLRVKVNGSVEDDYEFLNTSAEQYEYDTGKKGGKVKYSLSNVSLPATVQVSAKDEYNNVKVFLVSANSKDVSEKFEVAYEDVLVSIDSQEDDGNLTTLHFAVDKTNSSYSISNVKFITDTAISSTGWQPVNGVKSISNGYKESYKNTKDQAEFIVGISYHVSADDNNNGACSIGDATTRSACEATTGYATTGTCTYTYTITSADAVYACPEGYRKTDVDGDGEYECTTYQTIDLGDAAASTRKTLCENNRGGTWDVDKLECYALYTSADGDKYVQNEFDAVKESTYVCPGDLVAEGTIKEGSICSKSKKDITGTDNAACTYTVEGKTISKSFERGIVNGVFDPSTDDTKVCIFKGTKPNFVTTDDCDATHTWSNMNDYFRVTDSKFAMISKAKSSN